MWWIQGTGVDMYSSMLDFELENWDHIVTLRKKCVPNRHRIWKPTGRVERPMSPPPPYTYYIRS